MGSILIEVIAGQHGVETQSDRKPGERGGRVWLREVGYDAAGEYGRWVEATGWSKMELLAWLGY